jgi:hypothetical protein
MTLASLSFIRAWSIENSFFRLPRLGFDELPARSAEYTPTLG